MRARWIAVGLLAWGLAAQAQAQTENSGATSNDVERVAREMERSQQVLQERVKALEAKVAQHSDVLGDRRGAERFDTMAEEMREVKKRLDRIERDLRQLQQSVNRLERGR
jgi:peptidoglycan hydrolase CwlO-like protein